MCRDRPGPQEMWHCPPSLASLVRTKWPEQTVLRREREGRERGGAGRHPIPTFHLCSPRHPQTLRLRLSPSWPSLAQLEAQPACARGTCVPVCPPTPTPPPAGSHAQMELVSQHLGGVGLEARVWGSGPAPCMSPGCWQGPRA